MELSKIAEEVTTELTALNKTYDTLIWPWGLYRAVKESIRKAFDGHGFNFYTENNNSLFCVYSRKAYPQRTLASFVLKRSGQGGGRGANSTYKFKSFTVAPNSRCKTTEEIDAFLLRQKDAEMEKICAEEAEAADFIEELEAEGFTTEIFLKFYDKYRRFTDEQKQQVREGTPATKCCVNKKDSPNEFPEPLK